MHDIRLIRENPEAFDAALTRRGIAPVSADVLAIDAARRAKITASEAAQAERNTASKEVGQAKARGDEAGFERLRALVAAKKEEIARLEAEAAEEDRRLTDLLLAIPNLPLESVPDGADESANVELRRWGNRRNFSFKPRQHYELGEAMGAMDFELAAKLSGSRFMTLKGAVSRLHRALAQFMLDTHVDANGLIEVWAPVLVRDAALKGTGQLPKFEYDLFFAVSGETLDMVPEMLWETIAHQRAETEAELRYHIEATAEFVFEGIKAQRLGLIPTAEVTLTNIPAGEIVEEARLPMRLTAHTQCFRAEAGAAGKDTRGMLRQHQFEKVEMVSITRPEDSEAELERMTRCAEDLLERLGIPYRTVVLSTGDMGFAARRTHDIEVWLPGQDTYREISSCSNCGDFQARRMNARFRRAGEKRPEFLHTLNGSGLAVGRTLIAVMENYQEEDGSITIPEAVRPYMGGARRIGPDGSLG